MNGTVLKTQGVQEDPPVLAVELLRQTINPFADRNGLISGIPELRKQPFGKATLDCIMLDQPIPGYVGSLPLGLFPTFCLDPGAPSLRISFEFDGESTVRERVGSFRNRQVPLDLGISNAATLVARSHVALLEGRAAAYPESADTTGLAEDPASKVLLSGGVVAGAILNKVSPIYPESARQRRISGKWCCTPSSPEMGMFFH